MSPSFRQSFDRLSVRAAHLATAVFHVDAVDHARLAWPPRSCHRSPGCGWALPLCRAWRHRQRGFNACPCPRAGVDHAAKLRLVRSRGCPGGSGFPCHAGQAASPPAGGRRAPAPGECQDLANGFRSAMKFGKVSSATTSPRKATTRFCPGTRLDIGRGRTERRHKGETARCRGDGHRADGRMPAPSTKAAGADLGRGCGRFR